jgi:hypothetical protein
MASFPASTLAAVIHLPTLTKTTLLCCICVMRMGLGPQSTAVVLFFSALDQMPPPNFYHDHWPHPAPENTQNPSMWMHAPAQAAPAPFYQPQLQLQPQYRRSPQRMDGHAANSQTPPAATRLRTGSNYDPNAAESEYGPYYFDENISFMVSAPLPQTGSGARQPDRYTHTRSDGPAHNGRDWIPPNNPHDGVTAQLTGRIEMLRQRIGAVERSREQEQRAGREQSSGPESALPPAHQGVRWAYPAENRPGFWETGYGPHGARQGELERVLAASRSGPISSTSLVRANIPPPVVVPDPEAAVPSAPVTGHKVYVLDCKSCGTFLSNRGMKVRNALCYLSCRFFETHRVGDRPYYCFVQILHSSPPTPCQSTAVPSRLGANTQAATCVTDTLRTSQIWSRGPERRRQRRSSQRCYMRGFSCPSRTRC